MEPIANIISPGGVIVNTLRPTNPGISSVASAVDAVLATLPQGEPSDSCRCGQRLISSESLQTAINS